MSYGEEQRKEIETIREKKISVKLSEADCVRLSKLCGEHNITISTLLESFIGDLVCGTYTNGSDERDYARRYFERCWFGMFPEKTLLNFLLGWECDYDVECFLDLVEDIQTCREDIESCDDEEELEFLKQELADWEHQLAEIKDSFTKANEKADWEQEVANVKKWFEEMERMRDE